MSDDIPCGKNGFLYVGACSDSCGSPYYQPNFSTYDERIGHECCSTVAQMYEEMLGALEFMHVCSDEDYGKARVRIKDVLLKVRGGV